MTSRNPRKIVFTTIGVLFFVLVILFAYGRFGRYIHGPMMSEISLQEFQSIDTSSLLVSGEVSNVQYMNINGRALALDKDEGFNERVVVPPGYSIIEIQLVDSFGKQRHYTYNVYSEQDDGILPRSYQEATALLEQAIMKTSVDEHQEVNEETGEESSSSELLTTPSE